MNLFQKDLNLIDGKIKENRKKVEELNQQCQSLKNEKSELELSFYENNKNINNIMIIKRKTKRNYDNIKLMRKKKKLILIIFILFEIFVLVKFGFFSNSISSCLGNMFGGFLVNVALMSGYNYKINKIKKKNKKDRAGLSTKKINDNIELWEKTKEYLLSIIKGKEAKIEELNEEINKLNIEFAKLTSDYNVVLEYYQNILNQLNVLENEEIVEETINKEHVKVFPIIIKKLYGKKL